MSQGYDDLYDPEAEDGEQEEQPGRTNAEWARLRREAKAARDAKAEAEAAKRELAFTRAGLDPVKDPRLAYFIKGYDGESTPEAILKAAQDAGFIAAPETGPTPEQRDALAASGRIDSAAAGAGVGYAGPQNEALAAIDDAYRAAGSEGVIAKLAEFGVQVASD